MLRYDASAAERILPSDRIAETREKLAGLRDEVFADVARWHGESAPPAALKKDPLDAGFLPLPADLLAEFESKDDGSLVGRILATAAMLREQTDRFVVLGIGGSYMGARALFEALCHPYHNELPPEARKTGAGIVPRISFQGNNLDNDATAGLLDLLQATCRDKSQRSDCWSMTVISKSGGTLETAIAFRVFRDTLEDFYGPDSPAARELVIPVTGESGRLRDLSNERGYPVTFPIPDGVGGRFSVFSAVGLLPAAVLGLDVPALLRGAADMNERFRTAEPGENPVIDYTAVCHVAEEFGMPTRVLSTWGARLEALGLWYDQLLAESLGKDGRGALPLTVVNTRDLHSRGQQHQEGRRDKIFTNVIALEPSARAVTLPQAGRDEDRLNEHAGKPVRRFLQAAIEGTNKAYAEDGIPTADITLPRLDEHTVGGLLQMFMLATVLEGELIGINPYGQPGVEAYKRFMQANLKSG
jgi:glucose-6-phosphate isomerase